MVKSTTRVNPTKLYYLWTYNFSFSAIKLGLFIVRSIFFHMLQTLKRSIENRETRKKISISRRPSNKRTSNHLNLSLLLNTNSYSTRAVQIIHDTLEERLVRDSVTKCHIGKEGGLPKCRVTFFVFLFLFGTWPIF